MIIQPEWGTRNVNKYFYESEARRIAAPARYLAASGSRSSRQMDVQARLAPSESAKAAFDGRNGCQKCFCVTFGESNKAYAPYPALITRTGRKDID